jgi:hypothetical protein
VADQPAEELDRGWHYGPTEADSDPGKRWHYECGGEVMFFDDGDICDCGKQWERPTTEEST